jgi:thioredoxin 1
LFANIIAVRYLTLLNTLKSNTRCSNRHLNMKENFKYNILQIRFCTLVIIIFFSCVISCKNDASSQTQPPVNDAVIRSIDNVGQLNKIVEISNERLLILEFYADWCPPCKDLAPILEKIAKEKSDTVAIYKIDIDRHHELSNSFRVTGIPHVAFVKNKENIFSLTGLYPKTMYLKVIEQYTKPAES